MNKLIKILLLSMIISVSLMAQESQNVQIIAHPYTNITEAGLSALITMGDGSLEMSVANISSWQQNRYTSIGLGIGFERDLSKRYFREKNIPLMYLPIFADFRFSLPKDQIIPFFFVSSGYSFNLNDKIDYEPYTDSEQRIVKKSVRLNNIIHLSTGIGFQFKTVSNQAYHISLGCDLEPRNTTTTYDYIDHSEEKVRNDMWLGLTLKTGFSL